MKRPRPYPVRAERRPSAAGVEAPRRFSLARQAAPGLRQGRHGHRRQCERPHRRRGDRAADEPRAGAGAGRQATVRAAELGLRGCRSRPSAPHGPIPKPLQRAGLEFEGISRIDLHEAFAAQVVAVVKMLGSPAFAERRPGRTTAIGEVDPARLNVHGGSIALGHPFGTTGAHARHRGPRAGQHGRDHRNTGYLRGRRPGRRGGARADPGAASDRISSRCAPSLPGAAVAAFSSTST